MTDTDKEFVSIVDDLISKEANDLLDKHIDRARKWVAKQREAGEHVELRSLIVQLHGEPSHKGPVVAAYAAALWRLLEEEQ